MFLNNNNNNNNKVILYHHLGSMDIYTKFMTIIIISLKDSLMLKLEEKSNITDLVRAVNVFSDLFQSPGNDASMSDCSTLATLKTDVM